MKLTQVIVSKLRLPDGKAEAFFADDALPGFGVRLRGPSRQYVARYRLGGRGGQERRITIGSAEALSYSDARAEAKKILGARDAGRDVQAERRAERERRVDTLSGMVALYLAQAEHGERWAREARRYLERDLAPLHRVPLAELDRRCVAGWLAKRAEAAGPVAANRAQAALRACLTWGMRSGLTNANPAGDVPQREERSRDRVLSDAELTAVWRALPAGDYGAIVKLLILTGQRREEVAGLRWSELSSDGDLWTLPGERAKNGRPHEVPLSRQAFALVSALPRRIGRDLAFGQGSGPFSGWSQSKARLDVASGVAGWTLHDIRRSVITKMVNDLDVSPHVAEAVVNHVSGHRAGVAGVYNRSAYTTQKRTALQAWADRLDRLFDIRDEPSSYNFACAF